MNLKMVGLITNHLRNARFKGRIAAEIGKPVAFISQEMP